MLCFLTACQSQDNINPFSSFPSSQGPETAASSPATTFPVTIPKKEYTASQYLEALIDADYNNKDFKIAAFDYSGIFPNGETGYVNSALKQRNEAVEKKYNINLSSVEGISSQNFIEKTTQDYKSGLYFCDVMVFPSHLLSYFVASDMLLNVHAMPFTDFSMPYFNEKAMNALSAGKITYGISGDFTEKPDDVFGIFFNETLINENHLTSPYALVKENNWTYEKFLEYSKAILYNVNANDPDSLTEKYGYTLSVSSDEFFDILWASSGQNFFNNSPPSPPQIAYDTQTTVRLIEFLSEALYSDAYLKPTQSDALSSINAFKENEVLFFIDKTSAAKDLVSSGVKWGLVPLPSVEGYTSLSSYTSQSSLIVCVPKNSMNTDYAGTIIQALFAASYKDIQKAYIYEYTYNYLPNYESVDSFTTILSNRFYDSAFSLGTVFTEFYAASKQVVLNAISNPSSFSKNYSAAVKSFNDNYALKKLFV